ncbi:UPF0182 family protein [bacterium]|nr:UPF0182 family protein [bacterium]
MNRNKFLIVMVILFLIFLSSGQFFTVYTDLLWFQAIRYSSVFWTMLFAKFYILSIFAAVFLVLFWINIYIARFIKPNRLNWKIPIRKQDAIHIMEFEPRQVNRFIVFFSILLALFMGLWPAMAKWESFLKFFFQVPFGKTDPIFGKDIGFFVFSYPILSFIQKWLFYAVAACLLTSGFIYLKDQAIHLKLGDFRFARRAKAHLSSLCAILLILIAWDKRLKMFGLLYSPRGAAFGASYTDMHAQMVAYWAMLVIAAACAILFWLNISSRGWKLPLIGVGVMLIVSILISGLYPSVIQRFIVIPNELTKETPYIKNNILYTLIAYNLDSIEEKDFEASETLTMEDINNNSATVKNIKIWDKRPLKQTYAQMQELRPYYKFTGIDEDRYCIDGQYTQVMLSGRELIQEQLPEEAKTWENQQFKYTHGYGLCMSPVNHVTEKGLPSLIIRDIPPLFPNSLEVVRPQIYYGENTSNYVIVNNKSGEFDYPKGDKNVYTDYTGYGGVPIGSLLAKTLFSFRFSDPKIFLTGYTKPDSRIMFHRSIRERVRTVAPFLTFDRDPYLVLGDGRLFWIQDAYTTTDKYPYSEPYRLPPESEDASTPTTPFGIMKSQASFMSRRINYIRNSVKIVIDAYNGSMDFYLSDHQDPIISTYSRIFPDLFKKMDEMPDYLLSHIRYPRDLFNIQTRMYATYHMHDPQVFYNKEDLWEAPVKISGQGETLEYNRLMDPYYVTLQLENKEKEEFLIMLPFTPYGEKKNNMIAWMCARCDSEEYGKLLVYKFPKEKLIYGPRQIEARIDQQTEISSELTLWSQRGSEVFRGELLVIPIEKSIIYIEPVYLMASQDELPELKRVIVAFGDTVEMRQTLDEALKAVFLKNKGKSVNEKRDASKMTGASALPSLPETGSLPELIRQANDLYNEAVRYQRSGDWTKYGEKLENLRSVLQRMSKLTSEKDL